MPEDISKRDADVVLRYLRVFEARQIAEIREPVAEDVARTWKTTVPRASFTEYRALPTFSLAREERPRQLGARASPSPSLARWDVTAPPENAALSNAASRGCTGRAPV
ncbi:hypothetical protein [Microbispora catharanthi]|uniref:Uncharacterized protein n=1 Tax=Microbispora catharanthi TaxID=1712871 RepID=A0A5N6BWL9_9ACTN|nr:hypothetical protein [Microbispora catharanthi]KAB8184831.1 hypothetical protein FH610_012980 [Microbispora catharanthi]